MDINHKVRRDKKKRRREKFLGSSEFEVYQTNHPYS